ncbi:ABC transporter ATP-binding protein [Modicisalibacter luteus]|uniref:ABC transporter ATP-binding protein n=1 Tax=Modicisalibacter luteus TaxID=453962 RepID=A0ABV7M5U4_9GAMM|nr:ABC transporter ATP-binding protein [Halomonas lutea]GHA88381.1 ABC transporter ATP-binding protein [Halomonas lutea]
MTEQTPSVLNVQNVDLGYGSLKVVFNASLKVRAGELVGLIGGNGSGKSTMLRAVSGMIKPWRGTIHFDGQEVSGRKPHEMARLGLAHVPMGRQLFGNMTVHDNLLLGASLPQARAKRDENLERVHALFPDLKEYARDKAAQLSGGQQQMVAIARALMLGPKMLLLDEPSLGLSPLLVKDVMAAIRRVADTGMPILLVEQNVKQVLQVSDRAYVLENGHQVLDGPSAELQGNDMIKKAYLGL